MKEKRPDFPFTPTIHRQFTITPASFFAHDLNDEATMQLDISEPKVIILHIFLSHPPPNTQLIVPVNERRQEISQVRKA